QENVRSHLRNQCDFSAARPQKASGSAAPSSIHRRTIGLIISIPHLPGRPLVCPNFTASPPRQEESSVGAVGAGTDAFASFGRLYARPREEEGTWTRLSIVPRFLSSA